MSYAKVAVIVVFLIVLLILAARCAQETVPPSPEPTVEETLVLEDTQPDVTVLPDTSGLR